MNFKNICKIIYNQQNNLVQNILNWLTFFNFFVIIVSIIDTFDKSIGKFANHIGGVLLIQLKNISSSLESIVYALSNITKLEYAIFDVKSNLISCTPLYLKYKGKNVHKASIEEVLYQGNVVVNKPGYMKSCTGCRFVNNCPSTIEILNSIRLNSNIIGVICLTSFSSKGRKLIQNNINDYILMLKNISNLISMFAFNEFHKYEYSLVKTTINELINTNDRDLLIIDKDGIINHCSSNIQHLFSFCDLYSNSIKQILPENITNWILDSKTKCQKYLKWDTFSGTITSIPIVIDKKISSFIIELKPDTKPKFKFNNSDYLNSIITKNYSMNKIKEKILKIANSPSSVLITGETGTGKELVAKAIHYSSIRKDKPFVPINCANIPESLFESELFGYEEGAFTGARKGGKLGLFELANGGTIFLDEIGELPLHLQSKLLRVLQENTIYRLGSMQPISIDIRIIAATNRNLENMIAEGKFREDLYYRLNVIPIELPSLRERIEDVELLAYHFLEKYNSLLNKKIHTISNESMEILKNYNWPGNVRELENAIEHAVNLEEGDIITKESLPKFLINNSKDISSIQQILANEEYNIIVQTLDKHGWDVKGKEKSAEELGISLRTLYRRLNEMAL